MDEFITVELLVKVDGAGNWEVGKDADELAQRWEENIGGADAEPARVVRVKLQVPTPKPVELVGTVAAEPEGGELVAQ